MDEGLRLVLVFDDDGPEFARGFEAGRVWGILSRIGATKGLRLGVTKENAEMMLRMGEARGREVRVEELDTEEEESTHMTVEFGMAVEYEEA